MAFNFGGFLAGMSETIVSSIEEEEAQQRRFDLMAETDAMKQRNARKAERDKKQAALEESGKYLASLGWGEKEVAEALKGGTKGVSLYEQLGLKAFENGVNPNSLLKRSETPEIANSTLSDATAPAPKTNTLNTYSWNNEAVKALYGEPEDDEISLDMQFAVNARKQLKLLQGPQTKDTESKLSVLQERETFLINQQAKLAASKREEKTTDKVTVVHYNTLEEYISKNHAFAKGEAGFGYDLDTKLEIAFAGNEGKGFSSLLNSVYKMENTIGTNGDDWVNDRLAQERQSVLRGLERHAKKTVAETPNNVKRFKTGKDFQKGIQLNQVPIGSPVFVGKKLFVYTGVPNTEFEGGPIVQFDYTFNQ